MNQHLLELTAEVGLNTDSDQPKRFEILAYTGGKLRVDGFDLPVVVDLTGLEADGHIPIAIKHETSPNTILGQTDPDEIINDGHQLMLGGEITADTENATVKNIISMAKRGHRWQASIGAQIEDSYEVQAGETVHVNGQEIEGPFVLATRSVLRETSVLGMGADKHTSVTLYAAAELDIMADGNNVLGEDGGFEAWLRDDLGMDNSALTENCRNALLQQYAAVTKNKDDDVNADGKDMDGKGCVIAETESEDAGDGPTDDDEESEGEEEAMEIDKANKKDKSKMNASAKRIGGDGASTNDQVLRNRNKAIAANERRIASIQAKCGSDKMLCATAIEKGWSLEKAELEYLKRNNRKQAPAGHSRSHNPADLLQALQGAMIIRAGGKIDHEVFQSDQAHLSSYVAADGTARRLPGWMLAGVNTDQRQKVMEAAWKFRDMSMVDLCKACCQIDGKETDGTNQGFIRAAVSGGALPDIFTTNINALLLQKLLEHPDSTVGWIRETDANNFQTMERTRLTKGPRLSLLSRGDEADHIARSDVMQSYKISRYAQQFRVDEQDIIDDRFQALQDIPNEMALACARLRPDLVYTILLSNPTISNEGTNNVTSTGSLFSASQPGGQSNYVASGAALSSTTLQAALASMFNVLENNVPVNATPTHLIVPAQLFGTAATLLQSPTIVIAGTAGSVTTSMSQNAVLAMQDAWGMIKIVSDSRLSNGVIDPTSGAQYTTYSGSSSRWYLASNKCQTIEVAYLRGSGRAPQVRQYMLDKGKWGMGWDVNLDIGAKAIDWHGLYSASA